jgi:hypothetical protein
MIIEIKRECVDCSSSYHVSFDSDDVDGLEPEYCPFCGSAIEDEMDEYDDEYGYEDE